MSFSLPFPHYVPRANKPYIDIMYFWKCVSFQADSATVVENYPSPSLPPEDNNSGSKYPEQMPESSSTSSTVPSSTSPTSTPSSTTPTSTSSSTLSVSKKVTPELGTKSESPRSSGVDNGQPPTESQLLTELIFCSIHLPFAVQLTMKRVHS